MPGWNPREQFSRPNLQANLKQLVQDGTSLSRNPLAMGGAGAVAGSVLGGSMHDSLIARILGGVTGSALGAFLAQKFGERHPPTFRERVRTWI